VEAPDLVSGAAASPQVALILLVVRDSSAGMQADYLCPASLGRVAADALLVDSDEFSDASRLLCESQPPLRPLITYGE
jgi:hypothetical protein